MYLFVACICPDGFEAIDGTCYYFSNDKKEIDEAKWDCEYLGGSLATFDDCETLGEVTSSAEPCPYWINPQTSADCVEEYPPDYYYKYICQIPKETECELYCNGKCWKEGMLGCSGPAGRRAPSDSQCTCPEGEFCCVPPDEPSCAMNCSGKCLQPDPDMDNEGCSGKWEDADTCPCPYGTRCCCKKEIPCEVDCTGTCRDPTELFQCFGDFEWAPEGDDCACPTEGDRCCVPKKTNNCGSDCHGECRYSEEGCDGNWMPPEQCYCDDGRECCCKEAFDYEAMYEALMYYRSDPNAGEVKFDEVKEQFEKLSYQDGENLSGMTGDLTDTIKAMNDVWVLQYTDSETGYELAILLQDFDPATGTCASMQ
uniref:Uncharacterized protein n=1 Tax=Branchiostoma floridae TaxID=7739 RepID=C3ZPF8_BRAFL|eukprot:XP_002589644.1 hypothetical protein BRAFLDRAFT_99251 [Branchiostoma floridae]